jgi:hypothetical protein
MRLRENISVLAMLFVVVFVYAIVAMGVSRELVIPRMTSSSINGHIAGDPQYYHSLALKKAEEIRQGGIGKFELRPEGQGPAGVASLLYLIGETPYSVVFLNAAMHALSVVVMAMILMRWFSRRISIIATLPLAISPYMIVWFSQINKGTFAVAGALLFTYGLLKLVGTKWKSPLRDGLIALLIALSGILLTWVVRPYVNQILLPITGFILVIVLLLRVRRGLDNTELIILAIYGSLVLACLGLLGKGAASDETLEKFNHWPSQAQSESTSAKCLSTIDERNWRNEQLLPDFVNKKLKAMMGQRCLMFTLQEAQHNVTSKNSIVDADTFPSGSAEALAYFPRAALLGVFSPWPDRWGYTFNDEPSVFYTITPVEAALLYAGLVGLSFWLVRSRAWSLLVPIGLSVTVMTAYGMATPFLGALYRYRYPWWMLLICMGVAATLVAVGRKPNGRS